MKHYLIYISYDGTRYSGWQRLSNQPNTIQGIIEKELSSLLHENIHIQGSGRTDAGVSALEQPADFRCQFVIKSYDDFITTINQNLPGDIQVINIIEVTKDKEPFHARKSAISKHYKYSIGLTNKLNPFTCKYIYSMFDSPINENYYSKNIFMNINIQSMRYCADILTGIHDFSSFTTDKTPGKNHVRTISEITISINNDAAFPTLEIDFYGNGFLYNMVRILSGTILLCGLNRLKAEQIPDILEKKERKYAGPTLPSYGLKLISVSYL